MKIPLKCNVVEDVDADGSESKVPDDQVIVEITPSRTNALAMFRSDGADGQVRGQKVGSCKVVGEVDINDVEIV